MQSSAHQTETVVVPNKTERYSEVTGPAIISRQICEIFSAVPTSVAEPTERYRNMTAKSRAQALLAEYLCGAVYCGEESCWPDPDWLIHGL